ncbi:MAG TPA: ankyrin repeat domain-containing protein [Thermoguttaceae bacterium]|nr:ankyrin repeat domain-containing protein [Thermoguttaceae bacterium]
MIEQLKRYFSNKAKRKRHALVAAAEGGQLKQVKKLLKSGIDPNSRCKDGFTALMRAAARGHVEVVAELLQSGAEPLAQTRHGRTAVQIAVQEGRADVATLLQEKAS